MHTKSYIHTLSRAPTHACPSFVAVQVLEELATQPGFRYDLGQFEQIKQIGSGAFGRVLLCKHKLTGQKVVLKAIEKKHVIRTRQQHHLQVRAFVPPAIGSFSLCVDPYAASSLLDIPPAAWL